jgi:hypothetical protein
MLVVDSTLGAVSVALPPAAPPDDGRLVVVKDMNVGGPSLTTIIPSGPGTIDGVAAPWAMSIIPVPAPAAVFRVDGTAFGGAPDAWIVSSQL